MDEHPSEQNEKGWTERRGGKLHRGSLKRKYAKMRQSCISRKKNKTGEICRLYRGSWRDLYKPRNVNRIYRKLVRENRQIYPRRNASNRYAKNDCIYGRYRLREDGYCWRSVSQTCHSVSNSPHINFWSEGKTLLHSNNKLDKQSILVHVQII